MKNVISFNRLIVFFLSIGLLILSFEVYLQHFDQLGQRKIMWLPIFFGLVGGLLGLLVLILFNKSSYYLFICLMVASCFIGTLGLYLHNKWRFHHFQQLLSNSSEFNFEILTTYTPLLAPSAFVAIGMLGLLVTIYYRWGDRK